MTFFIRKREQKVPELFYFACLLSLKSLAQKVDSLQFQFSQVTYLELCYLLHVTFKTFTCL